MITEQEIIEIVSEAIGVKKEDLSMESSMSDFAEWDSLGHLTILSSLDEKLGDKYLESEELSSANTVREIYDAINK